MSIRDAIIEKAVDNEIAKNINLKAASAAEKTEVKKIKIENEKKKTLTNIQSKVQFIDIYPNVDLQYEIKGDKVKENIVIKKKILDPVFKFNLNVKNLIPKLNKDNTIVFYDKNKAVYKIDVPYMYDANNEESSEIKVSLNESKDGYELVISPDKEWLEGASRTYPITIDPPVSTMQSVTGIKDTYVCSTDTADKYNNLYLKVGEDSYRRHN